MRRHLSSFHTVRVVAATIPLVGLWLGFAWRSASAYPPPEVFENALFDDAPSNDLDVNGDGKFTVADFVALVVDSAAVPTETSKAEPTETMTPTPTSTSSPTAVPTPSAPPSLTPTPSSTFSPTATASASATVGASSTPTPNGLLFAGAPSDLVPHGVGDKFIYRMTGPTGTPTTETAEITAVNQDGSFVVKDQQVINLQTQTYQDTGTGVFLLLEILDPQNGQHLIKTTCTPTLTRLVVPLIAGQKVSTRSVCSNYDVASGAFIGNFNLVETFLPVDVVPSVSVPAGTFDDVVHIELKRSLGNETDEIYFAPGIGLIRRVIQTGAGTTNVELTSATVGGRTIGP